MRYLGQLSEEPTGTLFACSIVVIKKGAMNMRNQSFNCALVLSVLLVLSAPAFAQRGPGRGMQRANTGGTCLALINSTSRQALDADEAAGLTYMREEEKLAHDVYAKLHAKWGLRLFGNISQSEERHFDAIKLLLDRYELPDPAANNSIGVFQNKGLQTLYGDLIKQGESSLIAALRAGATIEDLDIHDLEKAIAATDNKDLKLVYGNLFNASKNHMRTFVGQLEAVGETYSAQYISPTALSDILSSPKQAEMGYGARGNGRGGMGRGDNGVCPRVQP
jgi:hypothetical protein